MVSLQQIRGYPQKGNLDLNIQITNDNPRSAILIDNSQ